MTKAMRFMAVGTVVLAGFACAAVSAKTLDALSGIHQDLQGTLISAQRLVSMELESVRSMLAPHGWGVERSSAGDLLLYPGGAQAQSQPAVQEAPGFSPDDVERLRARREPHGWRVGSDGDGSVLLFPSSDENPARSKVAMSEPSKPAPKEGLGIKADDMAALRERLVATGWKVQSDADGGLVLFPSDARASARHKVASDLAVADNAASGELIPCADVARLRARLVSAGWHVVSDHEEGLLLFI